MKKSYLLILLSIAILIIAAITISCFGDYILIKAEKPKNNNDKPIINVAVLKGPTGIGISKLMEQNEENKTNNKYEFTVVGTPEEIVAKISTDEIDIAAIPSNLASTLYNKTNGDVVIGTINTLGVLYIADNTGEINSIQDLKGKEVFATGQGAVPEFVLKFILEANELKVGEDVTVTYLSEHSELLARATSGNASICMLPEPFITTLIEKNSDYKISLDLTQEWKKATLKEYGEATELPMGVIIVRKEFLNNNKDAFNTFLDEYKLSQEYTNSNVEEAASLVVKYNILANEEILKKAISNCNITFIGSEEMVSNLNKFYEILFKLEPRSIGGKLPSEEIYYTK